MHLTARTNLITLVLFALFLTGCIRVKTEDSTPTALKAEEATQDQLKAEVGRFARVDSMRAFMDLKFEDNSFAQFGSKEVYRSADGEIVVQRPASILLKVKVPVLKTDVAQMTSDGDSFRVAVLQDGGSGKFKRFVKGSNQADYSPLHKELGLENSDSQVRQNVNAFANLRPQHFTDALLVRPIDPQHLYARSTIFQIEEDQGQPKKSPLRIVNRPYYLLDEFVRGADGQMKISRRFWFDRVGRIRLARQQIFDARGEIETDIVYGREGTLAGTGDYNNLPLQIVVSRPQERYAMKLTYQRPDAVVIGRVYPSTAFLLENTWNLEEVDLDLKLREAAAQRPAGTPTTPGTRVQ
jgi:hypothetical protein